MRFLTVLSLFLVSFYASAATQPPICNLAPKQKELSSLATILGDYPPQFHSKAEKKEVTEAYQRLLGALTQAISSCADKNTYLELRGELYTLGHNLDLADAFENGVKDFQQVIKSDPTNIGAHLSLAQLYVNTSPEYAGKAEKLFLEAQKLYGEKPLYDAYEGLFFAYYYQGKMKEALTDIESAAKQWPQDEKIASLHKVINEVMARGGKVRAFEKNISEN